MNKRAPPNKLCFNERLYIHFIDLWVSYACRYAVCGDQTLRRIALTRPSTRARLANIDGVNQVHEKNLRPMSLVIFMY